VQGLEPAGEAWAGASPVEALGDRVPEGLRRSFQGRLEGPGLKLQELAAFAAAFEHAAHKEAEGRLWHVYRALQHPAEGPELTLANANAVIDAYMASYMMGANFTEMTPESLQQQQDDVVKHYPSWPETRDFLRGVQADVRPGLQGLAFADVAAVVAEVGARYGRWQSGECGALKGQLVQMEERNRTGRVLLGDFYHAALHGGQWQFAESAEYLRQLGALDASDPAALRVIIPNYINSPSNCIVSSGYYVVCCVDECEDVMRHLEARLEAPSAAPAALVAALAELASAPRPVGQELLGWLEEVAAHHGGHVPLHSRLFAQWLHFAFPHECPYPHVSGTTQPRWADEWQMESGRNMHASEKEMQEHISKAKPAGPPRGDEGESCSTMWTMQEELVDPRTQLPR